MFFIQIRHISTSARCLGKRNFRKFIIPHRGTNAFKERQKTNPDTDLELYKFVPRVTCYKDGDGNMVDAPEMVPQLIVPDLTGFNLKPYVSYRVPDVIQSEFTPENLFDAVYSKKITEDFNAGKLNESGEPLNPSLDESLTPDQALINARKTGSDIFSERSKREEEEKYSVE